LNLLRPLEAAANNLPLNSAETVSEVSYQHLNGCLRIRELPAIFKPGISPVPVPVAVRRSSAAHLVRSWVPIPSGAWMFVCCECCVLLSGRGLCDGLITRPEKSYRVQRVVVCDQETSKTRRLKARYRAVENTSTMGCIARKTNKQTKKTLCVCWLK
jgi:hypothetical protein